MIDDSVKCLVALVLGRGRGIFIMAVLSARRVVVAQLWLLQRKIMGMICAILVESKRAL